MYKGLRVCVRTKSPSLAGLFGLTAMPSPLLMKTITAFFASGASAWVIGTQQTETHPKLTWQRCTGKGGNSCSNVNGEIVIDANWRW